MKKLISVITILALLLFGACFWLLSQSSPDKAPGEIVVTDISDQLKN